VVVAKAERNEFIVCQITSRPYASERAILISVGDFNSGSLDRVSYARADKLFTANSSVVTRVAGSLSAQKASEIRSTVASLFA
jgi:mRNA interferase MazF